MNRVVSRWEFSLGKACGVSICSITVSQSLSDSWLSPRQHPYPGAVTESPCCVYGGGYGNDLNRPFLWRPQPAKALIPFTSGRYIYGALSHHLPIENLTPNPYSKFFPVVYPNQFIGIRAQGLQETMVAIELRPLT